MGEGPQSGGAPRHGLPGWDGESPFRRALHDLERMHDLEVQLLHQQLGCGREERPFGPQHKAAAVALSPGDPGCKEGDSEAPEEGDVAAEKSVAWAEEEEEGRRQGRSVRQLGSLAGMRQSRLAKSLAMPGRHHSRMDVLCGVLNLDLTAQENSSARRKRVQESVFSEELISGGSRFWTKHVGSISRRHGSLQSKSVEKAMLRASELRQSSRLSSLTESRAFKVKLRACSHIMGLQAFDALCSLMIIGNAVLMGLSQDWRARNFEEPRLPGSFEVLDRLFSCWFLLELLLRIGGHGLEFFVHPKLWSWNLFDLVVVLADAVNMLVDIFTPEEAVATGGELMLVRLLRVLRITRALLVVRIFRFFRELRMMVSSVLRSGTSLIWSIALFMLNLFLFAVFFTGQATAHKRAQAAKEEAHGAEIDEFFGSMGSAIATLFMAVTGGIGWAEASAPLRDVHWSNGLVFSFFIFFTLFALTNIITGIFVDTAIQSAQSDRDEVIQTQLHKRYDTLQQIKEILDQADTDGDGAITLEDFDEHLNNKEIRAHMEALGLQVDEARELFRLLDTSKTGIVGVDEFIFGCMRLKGSARAIDLATLMYENKKMFTMLTTFFDFVEREFEKIEPHFLCNGNNRMHSFRSDGAFAQDE